MPIAGLDLESIEGPLSENESSGSLPEINNSVACIIGNDKSLDSQGVEQARLLKQAGAARILMIARPGDNIAGFRDAGVDGFLYRGSNFLEELSLIVEALGLTSRLSLKYE